MGQKLECSGHWRFGDRGPRAQPEGRQRLWTSKCFLVGMSVPLILFFVLKEKNKVKRDFKLVHWLRLCASTEEGMTVVEEPATFGLCDPGA